MIFKPLYYSDKLKVVNHEGCVGVVTLWTKIDKAIEMLEAEGVDLNPETSPIAVIGNLYGNGLPHLLRNMLYNPQISTLVVGGLNLSNSKEELINFFELGLEERVFLGTPCWGIKGTDRVIDSLVTKEDFKGRVTVFDAGASFENSPTYTVEHSYQECDRREVEIPEVQFTTQPSNQQSFCINRETPLSAWREVVNTLYRFGNKVQLRKGIRYELLHLKVVINDPVKDSEEALKEAGFDLQDLLTYQESLLSKVIPEGVTYTYGNRIRDHFERIYTRLVEEGTEPKYEHFYTRDFLQEAADILIEDIESRHAYISLWDMRLDGSNKSSPCLVSLFFRVFKGRLTLYACFRTHNAGDAWLKNVWGLMKLQEFVATQVGIPVGPITVVSLSISLSEDAIAKAKAISESIKSDHVVDYHTGKRSLRLDERGEFTITVDFESKEIVAQHSYKGTALNQYRGRNAKVLSQLLVEHRLISEISHALYIGAELQKAENKLRKGDKDGE